MSWLLGASVHCTTRESSLFFFSSDCINSAFFLQHNPSHLQNRDELLLFSKAELTLIWNGLGNHSYCHCGSQEQFHVVVVTFAGPVKLILPLPVPGQFDCGTVINIHTPCPTVNWPLSWLRVTPTPPLI